MIGIIAGSGLYEMEGLIINESRLVSTPFGEPSDRYKIGNMSGRNVLFLARHGARHNIPPHRINYRANIWGFKYLGAEKILSVSAVGGITPEMRPETIVIPEQVIDMTGGSRAASFFDGGEVVHIDFTKPYCMDLRGAIIKAARASGIETINSGTYICVNWPRLESAAEIKFFSHIGADVVGMTGMPEASLARELGICFAVISVVTNYAAGLSGQKLTTKEVIETMGRTRHKLRELLKEFAGTIHEGSCPACKGSLNDARM